MVNLNGYNLSRFVCLLHYQHGYWSVVEDAVADPSTNTLSFFRECAFSLCYRILQRRHRAEKERRRRHYVSPDGLRCGDGRLPFLEGMVCGVFLNT